MMKKISILLCFTCFFCGIAKADRVAIIGGGSAGLITAWLIEQNHQVTLYEAENYLGGQAHTITVNVDGTPMIVETGVDFFNETFYPHFMKLLRYLNVPLTSLTLVSTFYRTDGKSLIILPPYYEGKVELKSFTPENWSRLLTLELVLNKAKEIIKKEDMYTTLGEAFHSIHLTKHFKNEFMYPLLAAGWSVPPGDMADFSAYNTLKYIVDQYTVGFKWYEVKNGISTYMNSMQKTLVNTDIRLNSPVTKIERHHHGYIIHTNKGTCEYDHVIFATGPKALETLLKTMPVHSPLVDALEKMKPIHAKIAIHGDARFMPPHKEDWRVANVRFDRKNSELTIYKSWDSPKPIFKSWINMDVRAPNDHQGPMPSPLYALVPFEHSYTDKAYFDAQKVVKQVQGQNNLWYVGVWTMGRDIHESSVISAMKVAEKLAPNSSRLQILEN